VLNQLAGTPIAPTAAVSRAWYAASLAAFLSAEDNEVLGALAANSTFAVDNEQRDAWLAEISLLRTTLAGLTGGLFLEFNIPRMGRRIDAVVVVQPPSNGPPASRSGITRSI